MPAIAAATQGSRTCQRTAFARAAPGTLESVWLDATLLDTPTHPLRTEMITTGYLPNSRGHCVNACLLYKLWLSRGECASVLWSWYQSRGRSLAESGK